MNGASDYLSPRQANFAPLTPVSFIRRSASVYREMTAVIDGYKTFTYAEFGDRCARLAAGLAARGIGLGDIVAVLANNCSAMLEAHFGVPWIGAILAPINSRLDAAAIAYILKDSAAKILIVEKALEATARAAIEQAGVTLNVFVIDGDPSYESLLAPVGTPEPPVGVTDEWQTISLSYTSGTTGKSKGVLYHHRGAYLTSLGNPTSFRLGVRPVYGWTLPMFHCNGWCNTWAITMLGGVHVCMPRVDAGEIARLTDLHGITHLSGAPIILTMILNAAEHERRKSTHTIEFTVGAAPPAPAVLEKMESLGFKVQHAYGLTETYGPATSCDWHPEWDRQSLEIRAALMARQGVNVVPLEAMEVRDPETLEPVPANGLVIGELMMRGNTIMKGYHNDPAATEAAFAGGWFHSGDLGVRQPDGYAQIRDRSKDIIISGGENISSIEIESVLLSHPAVLEAAVVAKQDPKWGETPCAFVTLKSGMSIDSPALTAFCRQHLAGFKVPRHFIFDVLPRTPTGKVQKNVLRDRAAVIGL
jgi:fatty-acyl-CoA synthase